MVGGPGHAPPKKKIKGAIWVFLKHVITNLKIIKDNKLTTTKLNCHFFFSFINLGVDVNMKINKFRMYRGGGDQKKFLKNQTNWSLFL